MSEEEEEVEPVKTTPRQRAVAAKKPKVETPVAKKNVPAKVSSPLLQGRVG